MYDASARTTGPSLNDCLYTGPNFGQNILHILLRFRLHQVALIGDIEKAFLMVSVADCDRDVLRFLWTTDINSAEIRTKVFRFTRVVFGVSASPFLLNATIDHHMNVHALGSQGHNDRAEVVILDSKGEASHSEDFTKLLHMSKISREVVRSTSSSTIAFLQSQRGPTILLHGR